jgi:cysteine desulfurase
MTHPVDPVYLDHNASTPVLPEVIEAMQESLQLHFGNPSSPHTYGRRAHAAVESARNQVAQLLGCADDEILFTSGGTESNNFAIRGAVAAHGSPAHVLTSVIEHPATSETCGFLETSGVDISRAPVDRFGAVKLAEAISMIRADTALVTVMHVNSETGTVQPVRALADAAHATGAVMHTDAAQSVGKIPVRVDQLGVDLLTVAGHKLYAPKGVGALYVRSGIKLPPLLFGGGHENGMRPGTENTASVVGLGKACEIALKDLDQVGERMRKLRDSLWEQLRQGIPGLALNGHPANRLPNTLNVRFPGVSGNRLLDSATEIAASTGSACHAGDDSPSAVITAMGLSDTEAIGSVRLSLGRGTGQQDIEIAVASLIRAWRSIRPNA